MKTFILLTFGFLGFAFYEMSGGAEFEPASDRLAQAPSESAEPSVVAEVTPARQAPAPASVLATASISKIDSTPEVTRVSLNLTDVSAPTEEPAPVAETATVANVIDSTETPKIILPSLISPSAGLVSSDQGDVRIVSGNRVNVRGGPSTDYEVVSKLTRGVEVRVLEDNGDGWVRMQPLDGGEAGWMADFLLTSG